MPHRPFGPSALAAALSVALVLCTPVDAQQPPSAGRLVLAVSEGTSGGTRPEEIIEKYRPLADVIAKAVKMTVIVEPARNFERLDAGMRSKRFDLAMARPSDYPARAVRDYGYRYVANAKPDGQCIFVVPQASPAKSLADLKGKRVILPEKISYMARFCSAELRDAGFDLAQNVQHVKEQEVVVYQLQTNNADLGGIASYSKARKALAAAGLRELQSSRPQPYMPLIAGPRLTAAQIAAIRRELVELSATPAGKELASKLAIQGFDDGGEKRLGDLLGWLEKK
jgi:ABC-type phosphate/phosphonate transport system substrate-binding protein